MSIEKQFPTEDTGDRPGYLYILESDQLSQRMDCVIWKYGFSGDVDKRVGALKEKRYAGARDWTVIRKVYVPIMGLAEKELEAIIDANNGTIAEGKAFELFSPVFLYQIGENLDKLSDRLRRDFGDTSAVNLLIDTLRVLGPVLPRPQYDRTALQIAIHRNRRPVYLSRPNSLPLSDDEKQQISDELRSLNIGHDPEETPVFERGNRDDHLADNDEAHSLHHAQEEGHYLEDSEGDLHQWNIRSRP